MGFWTVGTFGRMVQLGRAVGRWRTGTSDENCGKESTMGNDIWRLQRSRLGSGAGAGDGGF